MNMGDMIGLAHVVEWIPVERSLSDVVGGRKNGKGYNKNCRLGGGWWQVEMI